MAKYQPNPIKSWNEFLFLSIWNIQRIFISFSEISFYISLERWTNWTMTQIRYWFYCVSFNYTNVFISQTSVNSIFISWNITFKLTLSTQSIRLHEIYNNSILYLNYIFTLVLFAFFLILSTYCKRTLVNSRKLYGNGHTSAILSLIKLKHTYISITLVDSIYTSFMIDVLSKNEIL